MGPTLMNQRAEATRARIIEAAADLMAVQGYHSTGVESILVRSGVSKGNFYHHFPSKEDLGLAVLDHYGSVIHESLRTSLQSVEEPLGRIEAMFSCLLSRQEESRSGCPLGNLAAEMSEVHEGFRSLLGIIFRGWKDLIQQPLDEAARRYGRADLDTESLARYIVCCIEGAVLMGKVSPELCELENSVAHLKRYIHQQFRG